MTDRRLSVYKEARWGAKIAGVATVSKDDQGALFIDGARIEDVRVDGLFSVLGCADGAAHIVLTGFLRLVSVAGAAPREDRE